jgi:hypothetical protein
LRDVVDLQPALFAPIGARHRRRRLRELLRGQPGLDLLVPRESLLPLRDALLARGFVESSAGGYEHQLPALRHPYGDSVELHRHLPGLRLAGGDSAGWSELVAAQLATPLSSPAAQAAPRVLIPAREVLIAHALVHALAQHGLSVGYAGWLLVGDLLDLSAGLEDLSRAGWPEWIRRDVSREETAAALELAACVAAGESPFAGAARAAARQHLLACARCRYGWAQARRSKRRSPIALSSSPVAYARFRAAASRPGAEARDASCAGRANWSCVARKQARRAARRHGARRACAAAAALAALDQERPPALPLPSPACCRQVRSLEPGRQRDRIAEVRALLAYLVLHDRRPLSRDHLAGLFWGDKDGDTRGATPPGGLQPQTLPDGIQPPHLLVDHQRLRFNHDSTAGSTSRPSSAHLRSDVAAAGFHDLTGAIQLYRGDLLPACRRPQFEWLVTVRSLREAAPRYVGWSPATRAATIGRHQLARLVAMDPSERASPLSALRWPGSGSRAAHFTALCELRGAIRRQPLAETRALHDSILVTRCTPKRPPGPARSDRSYAGGREPYLRLSECWQAVLDGASADAPHRRGGSADASGAPTFIVQRPPPQRDEIAHRRLLRPVSAAELPPANPGAPRAGKAGGDPGAALAGLSPETRRALTVCCRSSRGDAPPPEAGAPAGRGRSPKGQRLQRPPAAERRSCGSAADPLDDLRADAGTLALLETLPRWLAGRLNGTMFNRSCRRITLHRLGP